MRARSRPSATTALLASLLAVACGAPADDAVTSGNAGGSYDDLVVLFEEFRVFHEPVVTDGVPDYTAAAMQRQYGELGEYQRRLAAFDIGEWPISQQVDYHLVRAEMNGLEFYHRVMKPWSTSPDFYWGSPSSKGSPFYGFSSSKVEPGFWFWLSARPDLPLRQDEIEAYRVRLRALPQILAQGKANIDLAEAKRDMALLGIRSMEREGMLLGELVPRLREHHPELVVHAEQALTAVQGLPRLDQRQPRPDDRTDRCGQGELQLVGQERLVDPLHVGRGLGPGAPRVGPQHGGAEAGGERQSRAAAAAARHRPGRVPAHLCRGGG